MLAVSFTSRKAAPRLLLRLLVKTYTRADIQENIVFSILDMARCVSNFGTYDLVNTDVDTQVRVRFVWHAGP